MSEKGTGVHRYNDKERQQVQDAKVIPGRVQQALQKGPHGQTHHTDGSSQASANPHKAPLKGSSPGLPDTTQENYRIGGKGIPGSGPDAPHYGSKESQQGGFDAREPKPKGETHGGSTVPFESTRAPLPTPESMKAKKKK